MDTVLDIRGLRMSLKMRQRDLAKAVGVSVNELTKFERGLAPLSDGLLSDLLKALGLSHQDLLQRDDLLKVRQSGEGYVTSRPQAATHIGRAQPLSPSKLPILDLFCGVGGFSFGFELSGKFQVTAGIDLLGDRLNTFSVNHPHAIAYGRDIRSVDIASLEKDNPRPYVIVGGPPCQGFSSLRPFRNIEWNDPRNNLAEEFVRITAGFQPEWVVFENVVGLVKHQRGETLKSITSALEAIGYRISTRILNAAFYGLPQKRERLVIVGNLSGKSFQWPAPTHWCEHRSMAGGTELLIQPRRSASGSNLREAVTVDEAIRDLPLLNAGGKALSYCNNADPSEYGRFVRNGSTVLKLHDATAHSAEMLNIIRHAGTSISALPPGMVTSGFSSCYSRLNGDEPSTTITVNFVHPASNRCIHPSQHRALTPREGARLQGFFDNFEFEGTRSQIVKQIGNAVPPLLGKLIAEAILRSD